MKKLENTPSKDLDSRFKKYCESYSSNINTVSVQGIDFLVYPNVYRAESASTTSTILRTMDDFEGLRVLDMGCGTGILGIIAALKGASYVMMADINDAAIENTKANIEKHQLSHRTKAVTSDLFSNITEKSFDIILFNMPFLYAKENPSEASLTPPEHKAKVMPPPESFVDVGYKTIRRFMTEAQQHLNENGTIRCTFANFGNLNALDKILSDNHLNRKTISSRIEEEFGLEYLAFEITPILETA